MKRIGVTGAFGFLGANFIAALLEDRTRGAEGVEIRAFSSKNRSNPLFDPRMVSITDLDVLSGAGMAEKFEGLDALVHFAGRVDYRPSAKRSVWDIDVLGTKRVFDAALEVGVSKVLYVSSICALGRGASSALGRGASSALGHVSGSIGGSAGVFADERSAPYGDPLWPSSFESPAEVLAAVESSCKGDYGFLDKVRVAYLDAKLAGWELAKAYARDKGLPAVTIFPGTAVGPGDVHRAISQLVDSVWEGRLRLSFQGSTAFVASRDLARGCILALENGKRGEGYVLGGRDEDNLCYAHFQGVVANLARREGWPAEAKPPVLPKALLLGLARAAEVAMPRGSLSTAFVLSGSIDNLCTSAKARAELGYEPRTSLETAIVDCRNFGLAQRAAAKPSRHMLQTGLRKRAS